MSLQIIRAKPNPVGKDLGLFSTSKLSAEWIDIANTGITAESLDKLVLYHKIFNNFCVEIGFDKVLSFRGILRSGEVIRIHSGNEIPLFQLAQEDVQGADYHLFTDKGYIWNNRCGDVPILYNTLLKVYIDKTFYDPNPLDGKILTRIGNKLI